MARRVREAVLDTVSTFEIPGAQVAWLCDEHMEQVEVGGVGLGRPGAIRPDTRFPLGSATKVFTASLALQLVGDGVLTLDAPIGNWLPAGACREVMGELTVRQLLTHTSGLENDHASGEGPFGSPLEYVRACRRQRLFPAGDPFSYSHSGYVAIGHLIEAAAGQSWPESVQAFLLDPLEVSGGFFLSEPLRPGAIADGHVRRPDREIARLTSTSQAGRGWAPAAGLALSAMGLLRLVRLHLDGGSTALGYPLLDAALVSEMRAPAVSVPDPSFADAWGLGWALFRSDATTAGGGRWFGHDGEDEGWTTRVRASAEDGFAVVMLASCLPAEEEWRRLLAALASLGVAVGEPSVPEASGPAPAVDPAIVGSYENGTSRLKVVQGDDGLWLTGETQERVPLRPVDADRCLAMPAGRGESPFLVAFLRDDDRRVRYLHAGGRIARRAAA
jgi:CubicO group peptidase (beta-lactamase class C family)